MLNLSYAVGTLAQQHLRASSGIPHHCLHAKLERGETVLWVLHAYPHRFAPLQVASRQHMYMEALLLQSGAGWQRLCSIF